MMHLDWKVHHIRVLQISVRLRSLKSISTRILASNQGALWDVRKWSLTIEHLAKLLLLMTY